MAVRSEQVGPRGTSLTAVPAAATRMLPRRFATVWWFIAPGLLLYVAVTLLPAISGASQAFSQWDGFSSTMKFVGLDNFRAMASDRAVVTALLNTITIALTVTVLQNLIGLLLALGVNSRIKSRKVLSSIFFAPAIVMPVVVAFLWQYLYAPFGVLSTIVEALGLEAPDWLGDRNIALWSIIGVFIWQFAGYSMVIFLAGLQGIPPEVLEASEIDGATPLQKLFYVQLPLLGPALLVNIILTLIHGLKVFDLVWVMTQGGPGFSTQTLSTLIFENAFAFNKVGYSNAIALVLTLLALPVAYIQFRATSPKRMGA
jgi:raffinose/stachyose/melibiose transport system permease protein